MTLRGAFLISAAAVALLIGIARADGALAAIGFLAFLFVPICAWLGKRNLRDLQLHCQAASRTYAGQPFPAQLRMELTRVTGAAHSVAVHLQLPGQGTHACEFASVIAETVAIQDVIFELPRRGKSNDIPFLLESEFPLGLWKHSRPGVMAQALCVYPRPLISKKLSIPGLWRDATAMAGATYGAMAGEIRGLRPWRAGDSLKRIHPAASVRAYARGTGLIVAETDPPGFFPQHVTVLFHSYAGDRAIIRPEMFEKALSYLCGTLRTLWQQSIPATLVADFDGWLEHSCRSRKELTSILERLARVRRQPSTELHEFQQAQRMLEPDSSLIVISDMPVADWRSALVERRMPTLSIAVNPTPQKLGKTSRTKS